MALRRYQKPTKTSSYRHVSKWPYLVAFLMIIGVSFYFWGPWTKTKVDNAESIAKKTINLLQKEPEPKPVVKESASTILTELETYLSDKQGSYGYTVIELDDGRQFGKRDNNYYTAASTIKVAIFAYLYDQIEAGKLNPETKITYKSIDYESGTGSIQAEPVGSKYKISYLAERMIKVSDNVATNMLIRTLGRSNIQSFLNNNGLAEVKMASNDVTPRGMAKLLKLIYNGDLLNDKNKELLFGYMKNSITPERLVAGVPSDVEVAHKIGSWSGAISDIGIVFSNKRPYVIAVYSEGVAWGEATDLVIAGVSKMVYDFEKSF